MFQSTKYPPGPFLSDGARKTYFGCHKWNVAYFLLKKRGEGEIEALNRDKGTRIIPNLKKARGS